MLKLSVLVYYGCRNKIVQLDRINNRNLFFNSIADKTCKSQVASLVSSEVFVLGLQMTILTVSSQSVSSVCSRPWSLCTNFLFI